MPEQKLDLLQFSPGEMTQARATPAKIMGSELRSSSAPGRSLHNVPNGFGRDVVAPERAGSADSAKNEAGRYPRRLRPFVHRPFDPARHGNRSDVLSLTSQVVRFY
jgi:hypothetical protein